MIHFGGDERRKRVEMQRRSNRRIEVPFVAMLKRSEKDLLDETCLEERLKRERDLCSDDVVEHFETPFEIDEETHSIVQQRREHHRKEHRPMKINPK